MWVRTCVQHKLVAILGFYCRLMNPSNGSGRIDGRNGSEASNFGSILQGSTPSPIRLLADNRLCGGSCSIFASTVILHKMEVSGMQALPSISLHNGCDVWPRRFSLRLPRSVRLSTDEAGSHLTFLGMAASLLKKEMNSPCRGLVGEHISDPEPNHACHGWQGDMSLAF